MDFESFDMKIKKKFNLITKGRKRIKTETLFRLGLKIILSIFLKIESAD